MGVTRSPTLKSVTSSPTAAISPLASSYASVKKPASHMEITHQKLGQFRRGLDVELDIG